MSLADADTVDQHVKKGEVYSGAPSTLALPVQSSAH